MASPELPRLVWIPVLILAGLGLVAVLSLPLEYDVIPAYEAAAAATLKSGVYPAEVQFQAEAILDQDRNGIGEFGLLSELSGRRGAGSHGPGSIRYLPGPLAHGGVYNRYRFALYLPDGKGGAMSEPSMDGPRGVSVTEAPAQQERRFIAYAWPAEPKSGRFMFAITESGKVRYVPWVGQPPAWDTALGGLGWDAEPVWPQFAK